MRNVPVLFVLAVFAAGVFPPSIGSGADLFLTDETEVYAAIDKLNALGYLPGLPANIRPYSVRGVRAAAGSGLRAASAGGFEAEMLRWLAGYLKPRQMGRITVGGAFSDVRFVPANSQGVPLPDGWSGRASVAAREQTTPLVNGQIRYTSFFGEGGDNGDHLLDASIEIGSPQVAVQAGKLSSWYGPGRRGALIFTGNAPPYPAVRIHNPEPVPAPAPFSFLGALGYDLFLARMEKKERFSRSLLVGTRLDARPRPWLEAGFSRALHYGGEGRSDSLSEFADDYFGNREASGRSNTLTGWDLAIALPFSFQPVQAYWERAVEDDSELGKMFVPWEDVGGNLLGLYFPRILGFSRLDLRVEYADTSSGGAKDDDWYGHPAYPHLYRGEILGHPMGGGSRDWFVESRYHFRPDAFADISLDRVLRDRGAAAGESREVASAGLTGWLSPSWRGEIRVSVNRISSEGGVPGRDRSAFSAWVALSWQTNTLSPPDEEEVPFREYQGVAQ